MSVPVVFAINADRLPAWAFYDAQQDLALAGASGNNGHRPQRRRVRRPPDGARRPAAATGHAWAGRRCPSGASSTVARSHDVTVGRRRHRLADAAQPRRWPTASSTPSSLTGSSDRLPTPAAGKPGSPGSNEAVIDLANVGVRDAGDSLQFAVTQYDEAPDARGARRSSRSRSTPTATAPTSTSPTTTTTRRSSPVDGRSMVWAGARGRGRCATARSTPTSTRPTRSTPCRCAALGLKPGQTFSFRVLAFDRYFTGHLEDSHHRHEVHGRLAPLQRRRRRPPSVVPAHAASADATVRRRCRRRAEHGHRAAPAVPGERRQRVVRRHRQRATAAAPR